MDNRKLRILEDLCPCLPRRICQKNNMPNFIELKGNDFQILDSISISKEDSKYNEFIEDNETTIDTEDNETTGISDIEDDVSSHFYSSNENKCYQYGNIDLEYTYNNDIFRRNESRYRTMMSLYIEDKNNSQIDISQFLPFIPNFILDNLIKKMDNLEIGLYDESKVSINVLEYEAIVVFCDATGFTSLADSLCNSKCGAVRLGSCLNKFLDPLIETIYSWGGEIISFSGDAVTACWLINPSNNKNADGKIDSSLLALACCSELHLGLNKFPTPISDKVLSLHIGIEYGNIKFTPLRVYQDSSISYLITGAPIIESAKGATLASAGETVIGPNLFDIIKNSIRTTKLDSGFHKLKHTICSHPENPEKKNVVNMEENKLIILKQLIQPSIFNLLHSGLGTFCNELRIISAVFVGIKRNYLTHSNIDHDVTSFHIECVKISKFYGGVLNKTIIDDKGIVSLLIFGLPPDYKVDYATRAVLAARKIVKNCKASAGVVTGYVWCGLLGNKLRKEYTVLGDLINISARFMDLADEGQVLVDQQTFKRVKKIPLILSTHKKIKGKNYDLDIYQIANEGELNSQSLSNQNVSHHLGKLINWELWPFKKNINNILDSLSLSGGVKNIIVSNGEGLSEVEVLSSNYFSSKNWTCLKVKDGNWRDLLSNILSKNRLSRAKQLLPPKFHSRVGILFDSPIFGEEKNILKNFSYGLDLESARKVWGSVYEVIIELIKGYGRSFGSTGVLIIVEKNNNDLVLEEIVKFVLFNNKSSIKIAILILGNNPLENIPIDKIEPLSREETKQLTSFILKQNIESPNIKLLSEYIYKITGGSSKYIFQTIKLLMAKGIIAWEKIGPFKNDACYNDSIADNVRVVNNKLDFQDPDQISNSDFSISIISENEVTEEDLDNDFDICKNKRDYGNIIIKESLETAPIIESMWIEATELIDNLPKSLIEIAISMAVSSKPISSKKNNSERLNELSVRGIIRAVEPDEESGTDITYIIANDVIRRILTEKHISRTCS